MPFELWDLETDFELIRRATTAKKNIGVYKLASAIITKYQRMGGLNNRNVCLTVLEIEFQGGSKGRFHADAFAFAL